MIDLPKPLAIVCHDAGATNLILPWLDGEQDILPVMEGPAQALWKARFGGASTFDLHDAIDVAASVLTGTGWATDLEHEARKLAREKRLPVAAVIDHWVNFRERFVRGRETILPDEIWVVDDEAAELAVAEFAGLLVRRKANRYLDEQISSAPPLKAEDQDVLFVVEPARSNWGRDRLGEFQTLEYFLSHRGLAGIPPDAIVRLRPHPSDPADKYDEWLSGHPEVRLDRSPDLAKAFGGVRWVVGGESYALVVALRAGRSTLSAVPPWGPPCRLPHQQIVHLSRIAAGLDYADPRHLMDRPE